MASQAMGFAELLSGGILLTMGISGEGLREVLAGKGGHIAPLPIPDEEDGEGGEVTGAVEGAGRKTNKVPLTAAAARLLRGTVTFEGTEIATWIYPYLLYARMKGWKGKVSDGFRGPGVQQRIWDSGARPAAEPGTSNHEGKRFPRGAIDVSGAAELAKILSGLPGALLQWAGSQDPPHFSFPHGGSY